LILREVQQVDTDTIPKPTRSLYIQAIIIALVGNMVLVVTKALVAQISGSSAILADAFNSGGDLVYSILMAVGLILSLQPADAGHPHGHRRIEALVSIFIGLFMSVAGLAAVQTGIERLRTGPISITNVFAYLAPIFVVLIKGGMFLLVRRLGRSAKSPALMATARDNINDVITSAVALVCIIISRFFKAADPIGALIVSVWIFRGVFLVIREAIGQVIGKAGSPELSRKIVETASAIQGVSDVHQVILEQIGPEVRADLHINMDGKLTLIQVHETSDAVRAAIEALDGVEHAFVHVEPLEEHKAEVQAV
jgi:cation diffusion facilitator family transporter